MVTVITFYTPEYEREAQELKKTCDQFKVPFMAFPKESKGSWVNNCTMKADVIMEALDKTGFPVLWVDADARFRANPKDTLLFLAKSDYDFGCYWIPNCWNLDYNKDRKPWTRGDEALAGGTLFFNNTKASRDLLKAWKLESEANPNRWEQESLQKVWDILDRNTKFSTYDFDQGWCKVFDAPWFEGEQELVIEHTQASRRLKPVVNNPPPKLNPNIPHVYTVFAPSDVYNEEWVYKLKRNLEKNTTVPFEFVCISNSPLEGIKTIPSNQGTGWWAKMELFNPAIKGRVHYIDLDTSFTGNVDFFLNEKENLLYRDVYYPKQKETEMFILDEHMRRIVWNFWNKDPEACMFNFKGDGRIVNFLLGNHVKSLQDKYPGKLINWRELKNEVLPIGTKVLTFIAKPKQCDLPKHHWVRKYYWD